MLPLFDLEYGVSLNFRLRGALAPEDFGLSSASALPSVPY